MGILSLSSIPLHLLHFSYCTCTVWLSHFFLPRERNHSKKNRCQYFCSPERALLAKLLHSKQYLTFRPSTTGRDGLLHRTFNHKTKRFCRRQRFLSFLNVQICRYHRVLHCINVFSRATESPSRWLKSSL